MKKIQRAKELHRVVPTCLIYRRDGRFLLVQRDPKRKVAPGVWLFPGGGMSVDDYNADADINRPFKNILEKVIRREVKEEVGLIICRPVLFSNFAYIRSDGIPIIGFRFYAAYRSGSVVLNNEAVEHRWVTLTEAEKLPVVPDMLKSARAIADLVSIAY
jgi:8-oxo-dGTP pyrophosphatase MutT (NUDIX family)